MATDPIDPMMDRYRRQIAFSPFGEAGQRSLARARVLVVGCGGLGAAACSALVRAGVGGLRVVDPDRVELDNLHRQILYDERDIGSPKVDVARGKLQAINSDVSVEAHAVELSEGNVEEMLREVSLVIDATDNLRSRYLINDACLGHALPWIYGGVDGATGMTMTVLPRQGPCFCCLFPRSSDEEPLVAATGGAVLGPVPAIVAAIQAIEACKVLAGASSPPALLRFDLWEQSWQRIVACRDERCAACGERPLREVHQ